MSVYRLPAPYEQTPLQRRASGLALAVVVNLCLLVVLMTLGRFAPEMQKVGNAVVVDFLPESHSAGKSKAAVERNQPLERRPTPKPSPIVIPSKPTIAVAPRQKAPWIEMSKDEMASSDISRLASSGEGTEGDSEAVGKGPNGETLYAAEWARKPTDAELGGYLPHNPQDGFGLIACKTMPGNRVDNCVALDQYPLGSHLAAAVLNAAWQFRVRPPRKNGRPMVGEWVSIRIDYSFIRGGSGR